MSQQDRPHKTHALTLAFWLNLVFAVIEVAGGLLTNSTAIIADALHDFADAMAIGLAVWLEKFSRKKRSSKFTYGYKRFSLLAALGMSIFLLIGAVVMITHAIRSFFNPVEVHSVGMLWLAVLGILINGFAFSKIKKGEAHHHGVGHHHHHHNSKAIMLHLLEDVLGWVAVLAGAVIIYYTNWYWIDSALAIAIAIFIGYSAIKNLVNTMKVLLQSVPANVDLEQLVGKIKSIEGIEDLHDIHIWSLDGNYHIGSLHVVVSEAGKEKKNEIFAAIQQQMEQFHINHPTIQFEAMDTPCKLVNC